MVMINFGLYKTGFKNYYYFNCYMFTLTMEYIIHGISIYLCLCIWAWKQKWLSGEEASGRGWRERGQICGDYGQSRWCIWMKMSLWNPSLCAKNKCMLRDFRWKQNKIFRSAKAYLLSPINTSLKLEILAFPLSDTVVVPMISTLKRLRKAAVSLRPGSGAWWNGTYNLAWRPEFDPWNPHGESERWPWQVVPWPPHMLSCTCPQVLVAITFSVSYHLMSPSPPSFPPSLSLSRTGSPCSVALR